jgi:glycosyltransferase involved in cell wall biosynthesis
VIVYIISDINKSLAFEWIAKYFQEKNQKLHYILINPESSSLEQFFLQQNIPVTRITVNSKKDWPIAWFTLRKLLKQWQPEVVHCHLLQATILGLTAAWTLKVPKRIFTRHHGTLHHQYHPKGVLWDKLCNYLATDIVAITENVKNILVEREQAPPQKVHVIPHGFKWGEFRNFNQKTIAELKNKYLISDDILVIGVISRFTEWKGVQYIIPAFQKFRQEHPKSLLVLANAQGDYADQIHKLLKKLPDDSYRLINFEPELGALYQCFDLFVHTPIDPYVEAFGQTYIEALAAEIPSVFTLSGIACDVIKNDYNALVVPYCDSESIARALRKLCAEPSSQKKLKDNGWHTVQDEFSLSHMIDRLEKLYEH